MPKDSRRARQLRRLKRDRSVAHRVLDIVLKERNFYRTLVMQAQEQAMKEVVEASKVQNETEPVRAE